MRLFPIVSKSRKPKFEVVLKIIDLNNVPLTTGTCFVKWHFPASIAAEHRGRTPKMAIKEHKVMWEYEQTLSVRIAMDRATMLQECLLHLEVVQDYGSGAKTDKIPLGFVSINLSEYVDESDNLPPDEDGVVRRYLMQESKINSTLKLSIMMRLIDGERNFQAPTLKTAPVFGGIAGLMANDQGEQDESGLNTPSLSKLRDTSELQDMYRRALAASWAAQPDEMPADECIEDLFAGGDGWAGKHGGHPPTPSQLDDSTSGGDDHHHRRRTHFHETTSSSHHQHRRAHSGSSMKSQSTITSHIKPNRMAHKRTRSDILDEGMFAASNSTDTDTSTEKPGRVRTGLRPAHDIDEFSVREDLIAWSLPRAVS